MYPHNTDLENWVHAEQFIIKYFNLGIQRDDDQTREFNEFMANAFLKPNLKFLEELGKLPSHVSLAESQKFMDTFKRTLEDVVKSF